MAKDLGFDPLQPADWKQAKNADVIKLKASHLELNKIIIANIRERDFWIYTAR